MLILEQTYTHPVRAGRIRVLVYERDGRFLVAESRDGTSTTYATLGLYDEREQAEGVARARAAELREQSYEPAGEPA